MRKSIWLASVLTMALTILAGSVVTSTAHAPAAQ